ncbi:tudor domain-containing protein [Devosia sediminis]|uniref:Agenet-like domain-containing protein n=1 Tax=Devosia sediminis TaxID=2798801 RepID=A0A934IWV4_9HYPH|nr:tudor domain-containing protein [Devosia sediminis]MBJ3783777.1 hypothetical protein [Devosia sediminis]
MRPFLLATTALLLLGFATGSALAQSAGDRVLANYQNTGYWFAGVIAEAAGKNYTIHYDDGDVETVSSRAIRPYNWAAGTRVDCNWKGAGTWYPGTIAAANGKRLNIDYDDGDRETTQTAMCRSR